MTELEFENLKRAVEIIQQRQTSRDKELDSLTKKINETKIIAETKIENERADTANALAWAVVCLFAVILIGSFITTTVLIINGYAEHLEKIEKLEFVMITGGMTLMGWLGGYYFSHSKDKEVKKDEK